ncbi:MAG: PspC family transcriptional regulator [Clostridium butyricum]|nr:PspC family transcriptional regulator [Clostridium butyricum]
MNNKLKRIVANISALFVLGTVFSIGESNVFIKKVYAVSSNYELSNLELERSGGNSIQLYDSSKCKYDDKVDSSDIKSDNTYYTKKISYKNVKIDVSGVDDDNVRVFLGTSSSTKGVKVGKTVSLSSGINTLKIRVYSEDPGTNVKYKDKDKVENEYTIKVKYSGSSDDDNNDDDIYLKSLSLSDGTIDFHKKTTSYNVYVNSSVKDLTIKAKPEDEDDEIVTIDGTEVDKDNNYEHEVSLSSGKNTIEVKIENDDDSRKYTLYVYRGNYIRNIGFETSEFNPVVSSRVINTGSNIHTSAVLSPTNQWWNVNGHWAYIDSLGRQLSNTWYYDNNLGNYYYFKEDGSMATGWQNINGKWYYLYLSGAMAKNTWIDGCYVDSNGVWVL